MTKLRIYVDYIEENFTKHLTNPNQNGHNSSPNLPTTEIPQQNRKSEKIFQKHLGNLLNILRKYFEFIEEIL